MFLDTFSTTCLFTVTSIVNSQVVHIQVAFEVKSAPVPSVHILAAGCIDFETCAPVARMIFLNFKSAYIMSNTSIRGRLQYSFGPCTWQVHTIKPLFRTLVIRPPLIKKKLLPVYRPGGSKRADWNSFFFH